MNTQIKNTSETFTVSLSLNEIELLSKAVEGWETEPNQGNMMGFLFGAMLGPKEGDAGYAAYCDKQEQNRLKVEREIQQRKNTGLRLRAKLLEVTSRPGEFTS